MEYEMLNKRIEACLSIDGVLTLDKQSLVTLHNLLRECYIIISKGPTVMNPSNNLLNLLNDIMTNFNDSYKIEILRKLKINKSLNAIDKLIVNCITFTISTIGLCFEASDERLPNIGNIIIDFLSNLSDVTQLNNTEMRIAHICLYCLCNIIKCIPISTHDNLSIVLNPYFTQSKCNDSIKLSSAYLLVTLSTYLDIRGSAIDYLINVVRELKYEKDTTHLGLSVMSIRKLIDLEVNLCLKMLKQNSLSKIMDNKTGKTFLDQVLTNNDPKIVNAIKSKSINDKEINDWESLKLQRVDPDSYRLLHQYLLYRCIHEGHCRIFERLCTADIVNRDALFDKCSLRLTQLFDINDIQSGQSTLEYVAESGVLSWVDHVLRRSLRVDEYWTRAENIARKNGSISIVKIISSRRSYLREREIKGYSRLHIAVCDNNPEMIEYILEKGIVDPLEGDKTIGTALSLAYESDFMVCVDSFQNFNIDVGTVDWLRQSLLHVAICNRIENELEAQDYRGHKVLDRTILNDCRIICEQLLRKKVILDKYIKMDCQLFDGYSDLQRSPYLPITNQETIFSLCIKFNGTIYPFLLDTIDDRTIHLTDGNNNTLLHLSAVLLMSDICSKLISKSANVNSVNNSNNTPLLELLEQNKTNNINDIDGDIIDTVTVLMHKGAALHIPNTYENGVLEKATEYGNEKIIFAIIRNVDHIAHIKHDTWLTWLDKKYFTVIKEFIPRADKANLNNYITIDDIKNNLEVADTSLLKSLYDKAVDCVRESTVESILYKAAITDNTALFTEIINDNIYENSCLAGGESLLNCLIRKRKKKFIQLVIRSRNATLLLDKRNGQNQLPIHICIENEYWKIINNIILLTKSVNAEDNDGNTPLSLLLSKLSETEDETIINRLFPFVYMLITKFADINKENKHHKTNIEFCTKSGIKLDIETFARKHKASIPPPAVIASTPAQVSGVTPRSVGTAVPLCEICADEPKDCALNCGHKFCMTCADKVVRCYICRGLITDRSFISN